MAKSVSLQALAGSVEHVCGTIADLLVDLGKLVPLAKASLLPVAAECLTAKTVIGKLGVLLAPGGPTDPYAVYGDYNKQVEDLEPCFEVVLHAMSEILVDIDHETTRLRRYHTWGDPLASSKVVPAIQDFFIDASFCLRRSRSSLCLIIDCLQR
ncbi:hypothetical protein K445DRAFT_16910 [Daldinia sp. EC12]|nr:hypothetical protein F4774DRAFT_321682 [Daldinia eschscholtzii]OTB10196.1 hypothetical protein K445DRAFT_16910 [Daldinia sp. EC12]